MLGRATRIKLVIFALVGVLAIAYALARFTDAGQYMGQEDYTVTVQLEESGGIFPTAEVTYRGVKVGEVDELNVTEQGVDVDLTIEHDSPDIPSNLDVVIGNRSAIGEHFVDLRPSAAGEPYLSDGQVIPSENASTPLGAEQVIADLDTLANSVPQDELRTVVDESFEAFSGAGQDLQRLMDTTQEFVSASSENLPETVELLRSGNTVLETQNEQADNLKSFSRDLNLLSDQLVESDQDIRDLIETAPPAAQTLTDVVNETGPGLSALMANLLTVTEMTLSRLDGLEQVLVSYPILATGADAVLTEDGQARLGLVTNLFDPPVCTKGYEGTERRAGTDTSPAEANTEAFCAEPPGSPIAVRGAQNAPVAGEPSVPGQQQVEEHSARSQESLADERQRQAAQDAPSIDPQAPGSERNTLAELLGVE